MRIRIRLQRRLFAFEYGFAGCRIMRRCMSERHVKHPVFLANLLVIMKAKSWDQTELANQVGSTQSTVSRWGLYSVPRGETLTDLADIAGVSPSDLIHVPIAEAKKAQAAALPSGQKLTETMAVLLDSAGLPHLVDEYAAKLARLLPGLLADSSARLDVPDTDSTKPPASDPPKPSKGDPDMQQ